MHGQVLVLTMATLVLLGFLDCQLKHVDVLTDAIKYIILRFLLNVRTIIVSR